MPFQEAAETIRWRIHLRTSPEVVYGYLSTDEGRSRFWAEAAREADGRIHFRFPDGQEWHGKILAARAPRLYQVEYYGGSVTTFHLVRDLEGGTDLTLTDEGVAAADRSEVTAGWVSVLMALKAAADHGVDLRNHDRSRTWGRGYADN
jgi:uncharacterized protein YndB with AHSA1/START domain